ncbi:ZIP family metal transporter [Candidatus Uhrbacteria bacterium]|jgi:zinc and cadmium transporter|nr:ZIP family metal transporter [Candidatus Uhrbacteria bacterium]
MTLVSILIATGLIALLSLGGIFIIWSSNMQLQKGLLLLVALSAGAMFGNTFFHLLPEAIELTETTSMSMLTMLLIFTGAFVLSYLFEQVLHWHHCHNTTSCSVSKKPYGHLILGGDSVHNFIDGIIIATAFLVNTELGIATTIAIALHEVPQEIGDYAALVHAGWSKNKAMLHNFLASTTVILGGAVGYAIVESNELLVPVLIPFAAGSFLYIAAADLLPELKHEDNYKKGLLQFLVFMIGLSLMIFTAMME